MKFDVFYPFRNKDGKVCPGIKPNPMEWSDIRNKIINDIRTQSLIHDYRDKGDADAKKWLPAICFTGICTKTRAIAHTIPTQLVMIDIDHCNDPMGAWKAIAELLGSEWIKKNMMVVHITPSGKGLHIIFANQGYETLQENMDWFAETCQIAKYGDYDSSCKDCSRVSFAFLPEDLLFESTWLYMNTEPDFPKTITNPFYEDENGETTNEQMDAEETGKNESPNVKVVSKTTKSRETDIPNITNEQAAEYDKADWRGISLKTIIESWIKYRGEPGPNEVHNYYNEMVKYFRNIMGNNRRLIFYLLPKFGHSDEECWSQIKSICRVNTLSTIDKPFYFFLKNNGFYVSNQKTNIDTYMLSEDNDDSLSDMPTLPPIFREFVKTAPKDFRIPAINALMPILGTLTSYLQALYPYDDKLHTTSFFSIIYAPPGTGKGFVSRFEFLFDIIRLRDMVQSKREELYMTILNRKGQNEKSPENPNTSLRLMPPKNSESEFLEKQRDNHGYHMFTYAAEMDSWAKGEKAAGGNKSDMIRMAWDNDLYGQSFKSTSTFKGKVRLYWNVLITGTRDQVERYFKNVENGLVTRCAFTSIENQEFQLAQIWKPLTKKGRALIENFMQRCDENSYQEPCSVVMDDIQNLDVEEFDKQVPWRFKFKDRQTVDMSWIMPVINNFHVEQCRQASLDLDTARDVFRRRVGVRGFRLALLCTALYPSLNSRAMETIKNFVKWWMDVDIENMLKLWGAKYNEQSQVEPQIYNRSAFHSLKDEFSKNDLLIVMKQQHIKSKVSNVIYQWKRDGFIEKTGSGQYRKIKKNGTKKTDS